MKITYQDEYTEVQMERDVFAMDDIANMLYGLCLAAGYSEITVSKYIKCEYNDYGGDE